MLIAIIEDFNCQAVLKPPNPPPNWKHGNAATCGEAFASPGTASAAHKEPFSPR